MKAYKMVRAAAVALAIGLAACSSGSDIASPGATGSGPAVGGGGTGGGTGGGGTAVTCPTGTTAQTALLNGFTVCQLTGQILSDLTLPRLTNVIYQVRGRVDVGADLGAAGNATTGRRAVLTVQPGVTIIGNDGLDYLVVNRGSQIQATGTATQPIIFTSRNDITNTGNRATAQAEWGGVVLLGRAPINECNVPGATGGSATCETAIEGVQGSPALYGGATPTDSSGTLRYVQIRYPGFELEPGRELNGLTLGGVGNGTTIEYLQVHNSSDDGIEFFGGTVNTRYTVVTGADDDSYDVENGFSGTVQFAVALQRANGGDKLVESNNYTQGTGQPAPNATLANRTPRSNPTFANFTFIGVAPNAGGASAPGGLHQRVGMAGLFVNGIVAGSLQCLDIDDQSLTTTLPTYNSVILGCPTAFNTDGDDEAATFNAGANNTLATPAQLTLASRILPGPFERGRTASALPAGLLPGAFIGAFSPTETATNNWATGWTLAGTVFAAAGCPAGTTEDGTIAGQRRCVLPARIAASTTLTTGNIYEVNGRVDVGTDIGAAGTATAGNRVDLTIEPGVTIFGRNGLDYLLVNRGSRIFANGSPGAPIVMTSFGDITKPAGRNAATAQGEWGGLVMLGRAPINECNVPGATGGSASCETAIEGVQGSPALYGGAVADDSSGRLTYVQIKYPGFELEPGRELNGLTLGGVGNGTTLEYVQIHNSSDDGIEFFGGTVNGRYLVVTGADDDSYDVENGFSGNLQFLIAQQRANGGDKLVESNNYTQGTGQPAPNATLANRTPRSNPTFANFTFIGVSPNSLGAAAPGGLHQRVGMAGLFVNGIVAGSLQCLDIDDQTLTTTLPTYTSILLGCPTAFNTDGDDEAATFNAGANNLTTAPANLTLTNSFVNGAFETARPAATLPANPFFTAAPYIGAVRNAGDTWWSGWTCGVGGGTSC